MHGQQNSKINMSLYYKSNIYFVMLHFYHLIQIMKLNPVEHTNKTLRLI